MDKRILTLAILVCLASFYVNKAHSSILTSPYQPFEWFYVNVDSSFDPTVDEFDVFKEFYATDTINFENAISPSVHTIFPPGVPIPIEFNVTHNLSYENLTTVSPDVPIVIAEAAVNAYGDSVTPPYGVLEYPDPNPLQVSKIETTTKSTLEWSVGLNYKGDLSLLNQIGQAKFIIESKGGVTSDSSGNGEARAWSRLEVTNAQIDSDWYAYEFASSFEPDSLTSFDIKKSFVYNLLPLEDVYDFSLPLLDVKIEALSSAIAYAYSYYTYSSCEDGDTNCPLKNSGTATATAWADPVIYLDPTWQYASLFDVVVSPGINNTISDLPTLPAPVPEPSTFLLLGGGLAGLTFVVRRRKKE